MSQYRNNTELMNSLEVRAALEAMDQVLGEALKLVTACQETNFVRLFYNSRRLSQQLIQVEQRISNKNMDAMFAIMAFLLPKPFSFHPPPSQLKGMAETLPGGVAENRKLLPLPGIPLPSEISAIVTESLGSPGSSGVQEQTSDGPNGLLVSDGSSYVKNKASHPEITNNVSKPLDTESHHEAEWVEKPEPGIYITLTALPGGANVIKRVQFSRKRFSETQAEQWWQGNRARCTSSTIFTGSDKSISGMDHGIPSH